MKFMMSVILSQPQNEYCNFQDSNRHLQIHTHS